MPSSSKDSVELLLEGMAGPRPDRRKTKPQSDGEASAVYHAEHGLRRARNSSEPGPKVVVERAASAAAPAPTPVLPRAAAPGSREALSTFVPARVLRRRVAVALVAGVLIVLLSFVGLRLTRGHRDGEGVGATNTQDPNGATLASPAASGASVQTPTIASAPPSGTREPIANASPAGAQSAKTEAASAATPAPEPPKSDVARPSAPDPNGARAAASAHASSGTSTHHHASGAAAPDAPGDLGEFKTKF
jgi:hypothetical protein